MRYTAGAAEVVLSLLCPFTRGGSMFDRNRWRLLLCLSLLAACADATAPGIPGINPTPGSASFSGYPTEEQFAEMPPEFRQAPGILSHEVNAGFTARNAAYAEGLMRYFANYAKETATLS